MKALLILLLVCITGFGSGCTTIEIRPDGSVYTKGPRQTTVITQIAAVSTGKMLMDDATILALGKEANKDK